MKEKNQLDTDRVGRLLFSLAIPSIIGQLISLVYSIVDRMYIGHIPDIGAYALTGIGVATPLLISISAFAILIGMGGAPRASIEIGKGNIEEGEKILGNAFSLLLILALLLTTFFYFFSENLLLAFGASENTLKYGLEYMKIYSLGIVFVLISLGLNSFISGQGFSRMSMATILIGAIINIILDPIFIYILDLGVKGAALATLISQFISAFWVIAFLRGDRTILRLRKENFKLNKKIVL